VTLKLVGEQKNSVG